MRLLRLILVIILCITLSITSEVNAADKKTVFIFGDSRVCGINFAINEGEWQLLKDERVQSDRGTVVYENDSTKLILTMYGGASIGNGDFNKCVNWFIQSLNTYSAGEAIVINTFGVGDSINLDYAYALNDFNRLLQQNAGSDVKCYQSTIGPISSSGEAALNGWSNDKIREFNQILKEGQVSIIDVAEMLSEHEIQYNVSEVDFSGVHYTEETDEIILQYLLESV